LLPVGRRIYELCVDLWQEWWVSSEKRTLASLSLESESHRTGLG
jgi:hypothetical protein